MPRLCVELVPRDPVALERELAIIHELCPAVQTINIPDLLQFSLRSWEGCALAQRWFPATIPHLRAIDFDLEQPLLIAETLRQLKIHEVLVISGDKPLDMSRRSYRTTACELIRALKKALPGLKVYAGIDPYRSAIREELDYVRLKSEAGADGFFTQPFFDLRYMEIYQDLLAGLELYWGVCPVLSEKSRDYWENRNQAFFPPDFRPDLTWNREFARKVLNFSTRTGANLYFMPIRANLQAYLGDLLR
jgi:methylenetetrahydrofolate reductase (NADPH)